MKIVSTSPLPIDLAAQLPHDDVVIPEQWTPVARLDLSDVDALVCLLFAACGLFPGKLNWPWLGMFLWLASLMVSASVHPI